MENNSQFNYWKTKKCYDINQEHFFWDLTRPRRSQLLTKEQHL